MSASSGAASRSTTRCARATTRSTPRETSPSTTGHLYGRWTAAVEQAEAAATNAIGGRRPYKGSLIATHLKVTGIELTSIGRPHAQPDDTEIALEEEGGRYRKLVLSEGRIVGAILLGHPGRSAEVFAAAHERRDLGRHIEALRQGDWRMLADPTPEPDIQSRPPASTNGHAENGSNGNTNGRRVPANGNGNGRSPASARVF